MTKNPYVRPTRATIDLAALAANWDLLTSLLPRRTRILAVVKANGYGHGAQTIAKECERLGAAGVGVADVAEAVVLREGGFKGTILCLGPIPKTAFLEAAERRIVTILHTEETLESLAEFTKTEEKTVAVHVKVDTGMRRLGFTPEECPAVLERLAHEPRIRIEGVFTHLAESENPNVSFTSEQLSRFEEIARLFETAIRRKLIKHAANSGAILAHPRAHFDWVRPGIALYGYPPLEPEAAARRFRPIMDWRAPIVQVKRIAPGDTVGYNRTFRAPRNMIIATVAAGYGDGYRRKYGSLGVGFRGGRCTVLGSICMDLFMIDVSEYPDVRNGEEVFLIGTGPQKGPSARELAAAADTVVYEVLTGISARVSREFLPGRPSNP